MAAFRPPATDHATARRRAHPRTKSVRLLAVATIGLKRTLHRIQVPPVPAGTLYTKCSLIRLSRIGACQRTGAPSWRLLKSRRFGPADNPRGSCWRSALTRATPPSFASGRGFPHLWKTVWKKGAFRAGFVIPCPKCFTPFLFTNHLFTVTYKRIWRFAPPPRFTSPSSSPFWSGSDSSCIRTRHPTEPRTGKRRVPAGGRLCYRVGHLHPAPLLTANGPTTVTCAPARRRTLGAQVIANVPSTVRITC